MQSIFSQFRHLSFRTPYLLIDKRESHAGWTTAPRAIAPLAFNLAVPYPWAEVSGITKWIFMLLQGRRHGGPARKTGRASSS